MGDEEAAHYLKVGIEPRHKLTPRGILFLTV